MSTQTSFWEEEPHGLARRTDPVTSHMAAEQLKVTRIEYMVAAAIRRAGSRGLIAAELPDQTGLPLNTVTPRTRPLADKGVIYDSGDKRPGPSGKLQIIWKHNNQLTK